MLPPKLVATIEQQREGNWPNCKRTLPGWLLDKIADETITGGWNCKKSNICDRCNVVRSRNGTCYC